jgi:hypothetical protein
MKTIKSLKDITTLEVGDVVVFGDLRCVVYKKYYYDYTTYYLYCPTGYNGIIFEKLNLKKIDFVEKLGIDANYICDFPETKSLEALTALVSALFKEYEKQNELPKTWEEFCKRNNITSGESYISPESQTRELCGCERNSITDRNVCTSKQEAKAFLALMQLRQLRKAYVKDWEPDWSCSSIKFCILVGSNKIKVVDSYYCQETLSFPTEKLANQFLTNFKDLLEIAKSLL